MNDYNKPPINQEMYIANQSVIGQPHIGDPENSVKIRWDIKTCPPFIPYNGTSGTPIAVNKGKMQQFETGATRDSDEGKIDPEGAFSPLVLEAYAEYMADCRVCSDGSLRASDNWQKGIPLPKYMKSLWRHFFDVWKLHRGHKVFDKKTNKEITMKTALCALLFNSMGYLHEWLKKEM